MQGAATFAAQRHAVGGTCLFLSALNIEHHDRIERRVEALNAFEVSVEQLQAADFLLTYGSGQFVGRCERIEAHSICLYSNCLTDD